MDVLVLGDDTGTEVWIGGWLVYDSFEPGTGTRCYGFGSEPAPKSTPKKARRVTLQPLYWPQLWRPAPEPVVVPRRGARRRAPGSPSWARRV